MSKRSFTLIEIIITIVLLGIVMIPLALMSIELVKGATKGDSAAIALNLARMETELVNNMPFGSLVSKTTPNYSGPYDVDRTVENVPGDTQIKKITVTAYFHGATKAQKLAQVVTYRSSAEFGMGSGGNEIPTQTGGGGQAGSLAMSGGTVKWNSLIVKNILLSNTCGDERKITGVRIEWGMTPPNELNRVVAHQASWKDSKEADDALENKSKEDFKTIDPNNQVLYDMPAGAGAKRARHRNYIDIEFEDKLVMPGHTSVRLTILLGRNQPPHSRPDHNKTVYHSIYVAFRCKDKSLREARFNVPCKKPDPKRGENIYEITINRVQKVTQPYRPNEGTIYIHGDTAATHVKIKGDASYRRVKSNGTFKLSHAFKSLPITYTVEGYNYQKVGRERVRERYEVRVGRRIVVRYRWVYRDKYDYVKVSTKKITVD